MILVRGRSTGPRAGCLADVTAWGQAFLLIHPFRDAQVSDWLPVGGVPKDEHTARWLAFQFDGSCVLHQWEPYW